MDLRTKMQSGLLVLRVLPVGLQNTCEKFNQCQYFEKIETEDPHLNEPKLKPRMFRLIPLRAVVRTPHHRVDNIPPIDFSKPVSMQREMIAPNSVLPDYGVLSRSWNMKHDMTNTVFITTGSVELVMYCRQENKIESFVLTPENVHRNGKLYYGSPAMLEWPPGIFYKMRTQSEGCTFLTFVGHEKNVGSARDSSHLTVDHQELVNLVA